MATEFAAVAQGLECPLCFEFLEEPKLLSCAHTFCQDCLGRLYRSRNGDENLSCPVCRTTTRVERGDVSKLQTNVPLKSMVGDVKTTRQICTVCDPDARSPASQYCQQCDEYMCETCLGAHARFRNNNNHKLVNVDDIKSGRVKVNQLCPKHPQEENRWICTSCHVAICFRCRMLDHNDSCHEVVSISDYKTSIDKKIETMEKKASNKIAIFDNHVKLINEENARVKVSFDGKIKEVKDAFDESVKQLTQKRDELTAKCTQYKKTLAKELFPFSESDKRAIASISGAIELVSNGGKTLLEGQAMAVHSNICRELQATLDQNNPDDSKLRNIKYKADCITFIQCKLDDQHTLGELHNKDWKLEKVAELPLSGTSPWSISPTPDCGMAVGYRQGGIELFTVDEPQDTILKDVEVCRLSLMAGGLYVIRGSNGEISLYSREWSKMKVDKFETHTNKYYLGMDVDNVSNNIYVGVEKMIHVFDPKGGAPIREIPCHDYKPFEICTMNHSKSLAVSDRSSVRLIDEEGMLKYDVTKEGFCACPAVLWDDSILIGWTKDDRLIIELYTNQLKYVKTVLAELNCNTAVCGLREFSTGEIAVCDYKQLYVFRKV